MPTNMSNDNNNEHIELPKLKDNGVNNNYGKWETKSSLKLDDWDLLKYIQGPDSEPPFIPPLHQPVTHHSPDKDGILRTINIPGNDNEHRQAVAAAAPWTKGNKTALMRIVAAIPTSWLHLVKHTKYAKKAWKALRSVYQPHNFLRTSIIRGQLTSYCCTSNMNIFKWLNDMQRLYNSLCDLDPKHLF
jgi:gag-polypeptide of LTR copia-type